MKTAAVTNKNKPGRKPEHTEALAINEIWERERLTAEAHVGEFADHDPAQGAAIDHSIATGEGLFA
jgi:hypothetical protein